MGDEAGEAGGSKEPSDSEEFIITSCERPKSGTFAIFCWPVGHNAFSIW
jgi:hypothetical protein